MTTPQSPMPSQPGPPPPGGTGGPQPQQHGQPSPAVPGAGRDTATTVLSVQQPPQAPPSAPPPQAPPQGAPSPDASQAYPPAGQSARYESRLPVRRAHLGHAIAAEWTKILSVRSTYWSLGIMAAISLLITLLCAMLASDQDEAPFPVLTWTFFGMLLAQLAVIPLGAMTITTEYNTGMIRSTLTACPQRARVLTAKVIVFSLLSFTVAMVTTGLCGVILSGMLEGNPPDFSPSDAPEGTVVDGKVYASSGEWLSSTVGVSLYLTMLGLLGLAVGTFMRSSPGAITTVIGAVMVPFIVSVFLFAKPVRELGEKLREYSFISVLSRQYHIDMESGVSASSGWAPLGVLAAVTALVLAGAYAVFTTRDV